MKSKIKYENMTEMNGVPIGKVGKRVHGLFKNPDAIKAEAALISGAFISPQELIKRQETVKVSMDLNKNTLETLKQFAKKHKGQYQKMIRMILDSYVDQNKSALV